MIEIKALNESSVLQKIEKDKYHSCIITGFTFDFEFFELIMLPLLKKVGIVNIIVFIDNIQLQKNIGFAIGKRLPRSDYSIFAVRNKLGGVFHTKMIYCFGEDDGLLSIGSGNPTFSGYGSNLEIWGTYHYDKNLDKYAHLFLQAWGYLKKFEVQLKGHLRTKFSWIIKETVWLNEIQNKTINKAEEANDSYLIDTQANPIIKIIEQISNKAILEIVVFSPFYDEDLSMLEELSRLFPKAKIYLQIQFEKVVFPSHKKLNCKNIYFNEIEQDKLKRYVHAKIFIFKQKNREYIIYGSANCTKAAIGYKPLNEEVVVMETNSSVSITENLGIKYKNNPQVFNQIKDKLKNNRNEYDLIYQNKSSKYLIFLEIAELSEQFLDIEFDLTDSNIVNLFLESNVLFYSSFGDELLSVPIKEASLDMSSSKIRINSKAFDTDVAYYIVINHQIRGALSNKVIIQDVVKLNASNPNKYQKMLVTLTNSIETGNINVLDILKFISIEDLYEPNNFYKEIVAKNDEDEKQDKVSSKILTNEKINQLRRKEIDSNAEDILRHLNQSSQIDRIFEVLKNYLSIQARLLKDEVNSKNEDEEELDNIESASGDERDISETIKLEVDELNRLKNRISNFFHRYIRILKKQYYYDHKLNSLDISIYNFSLFFLLHIANNPIDIFEKDIFKERKKLLDITNFTEDKEDSFVILGIELISKYILLLKSQNQWHIKYDNDKTLKNNYLQSYYLSLLFLTILVLNYDNNEKISDNLSRGRILIQVSSRYPDPIKTKLPGWIWSVFMNLNSMKLFETNEKDKTKAGVLDLLNRIPLKDNFQENDIENVLDLFYRIYKRDRPCTGFNYTNFSSEYSTKSQQVFFKEYGLFCELIVDHNTYYYVTYPGLERNQDFDYCEEIDIAELKKQR